MDWQVFLPIFVGEIVGIFAFFAGMGVLLLFDSASIAESLKEQIVLIIGVLVISYVVLPYLLGIALWSFPDAKELFFFGALIGFFLGPTCDCSRSVLPWNEAV